ncbi:hypothetical protein ACN6MT_09135 [Neobacillus niacini]|uniref:hypothetical protein n=1 Tax=Neobacillus niacini TaxID=86668 RepID=UPI003B028DC2
MKELILLLADIVNTLHDYIWNLSNLMGFNFTDKDLHLWVLGIIGIFTFFIVHALFIRLAKYSITAISFIYTLTVILVLVFAIEIQQKITGRGQMEFDDAIIGLWGFLLFFIGFLFLKGMYMIIKKYLFKK